MDVAGSGIVITGFAANPFISTSNGKICWISLFGGLPDLRNWPSDSLGLAERIEVGRNGTNDQCNSNSELNQSPGFSAFQQDCYRVLKSRRGLSYVVEYVVMEFEIDR